MDAFEALRILNRLLDAGIEHQLGGTLSDEEIAAIIKENERYDLPRQR